MRFSFALLCSLLPYLGIAQIPANPIGSNPFSWSWEQINTDKIQVVFPQEIDSIGLRVAQLATDIYDRQSPSIGDEKHKITILLHPENVRSNAFVTVGPFRSEFYTVTPQYKSPLDWVDELTIHEYRHVEQFANATKGITKTVKNILGSWAWGGMMATALPRWYFEGDAVIAETALTQGGRGRFPEFNMEYHALLHEGKRYGYEKAGAGSFKDFVPSWYPLGYNLLSYGRQEYGADLWQQVADDAVRYRGLFIPFARSLRRRTGMSPATMYEAMLDDLGDKWSSSDIRHKSDTPQINKKPKTTVQHYNAAAVVGSGDIAVIRSGYDRVYELYLMSESGIERRLCDMGILLDRQLSTLSAQGDRVVWSELAFDPRWTNRNYSDIVSYDISERKKTRLTNKQRLFSPSYSPDGSAIVAIEVLGDLRKRIVTIDSRTGNMLYTGPASYAELSYPVYVSDATITYVHTADGENAIHIINTQDGTQSVILSPTIDHISHLSYHDGHLYFAHSVNEVSQIARINIDGSQYEVLTQSVLGAFQPEVTQDGERLLYSEFSTMGYDLSMERISPIRSVDQSQSPQLYYLRNEAQETKLNLSRNINLPDGEVKKFNKLSGLLNPHSLLPQWNDPEVSLSLLSDNKFGTLSAELSGHYNYNEDEFRYGASLRYAELYPIIDLSYFKYERNALTYDFAAETDSSFIQRVYVNEWDERRLAAGITLPYNFSQGQWSNRISLSGQYQFIQTSLDRDFAPEILSADTIAFSNSVRGQVENLYKAPIANESIHSLQTRLSLQMLKLRGYQNLNSRLGFTLDILRRDNLSNERVGGDNIRIRSDFYLPGFRRNHSFYINTMYMSESITSGYRYSDIFIYPRGYSFSLRRDDYFKLGFNYSFPIWYPDRALGGLAFIKRVKGNAFYDYGSFGVNDFPFNSTTQNMSSVGFELGFDIRAFRLLEIDFGVRYSYLLNENFAAGNRHQFDFFVISITE